MFNFNFSPGAIYVYFVATVLIVVVTALQFRFRFLQYSFFLRMPLLHTLILMLLPFAVSGPFHNLFVVTPVELGAIVMMLMINAWAVTYSWGLLFVGAAPRFRLKFLQPDFGKEANWDSRVRPNKLMALLATERRRAYVVPIVLGAPIVVTCIIESPSPWYIMVFAIFAGFVVAAALREASVKATARFLAWLYKAQRALPAVRPIDSRRRLREFAYRFSETWIGRVFLSAFANGYSYLSDEDPEGTSTPLQEKDGQFSHARAVAFIVLAVIIYAIGGVLLNPSRTNIVLTHTPALVYLLLVLTILGLLLPAVTFLIDLYRVPFFVVLALALFWSYHRSGLDHYYNFTTDRYADNIPAALTVNQLLDARLGAMATKAELQDAPIVVIAVSGGGGHSARWVTDVLYQLRSNDKLGEGFFRSIALVSTVSGGALGTMYALDRFNESPPDSPALENARKAASESNVGALAWGMAYPDLVQKAFPRLFFHEWQDRGWALEQSWQQRLQDPGHTATLATWTEDAAKGNKPAVVFNATLLETGKRFLISRVKIPNTRAVEFTGIYPDRDLSILSAVRLSAAFPYLSPFARPRSPFSGTSREFETVAYHVADGGYYDASGALTAMEFINAIDAYPVFANSARNGSRKKVALVEIRTKESDKRKEVGHTNWIGGLVDPLAAGYNVALSSQVDRTEFELELLKQRSTNLEIKAFVFHLNDTGKLPWHLSDAEMKKISDQWVSDENVCHLDKLVNFFNGLPGPTDTGQCAPPDDVPTESLPVAVVKQVRNVETQGEAAR